MAKKIVALEKQASEPVLTADEVDRLLGELKAADTRQSATKRLSEQGQGHIERIVVFACDCAEMEARQACTDIVEGLDASYRTTQWGGATRGTVS